MVPYNTNITRAKEDLENIISSAENSTRESSMTSMEFPWIYGFETPTLVLDMDSTKAVAWNGPMEDLCCISSSASTVLLSRPLRDVFDEESMIRLLAAISEVEKVTTRSVQCEVTIPETRRNLLLRMSLHKQQQQQQHDEKSCCRIVCFAEENQLQPLAQPQQQLRRLNDNFPKVIIDDDGRIMEWNSPIEVLTGYRSSTVIGRNLKEFIAKRGHQVTLKQALLSLWTKGSTTSCCVEFTLGSGTVKRFRILLSSDEEGPSTPKMNYLIFSDVSDFGEKCTTEKSTSMTSLQKSRNGSSRSISSRSASEKQQQQEQQQQLDEVLENVNAIIFEVDSYGTIVRWNAQAEAISGFSPEETLGQDFVNTFVPSHCMAEVEVMIQSTFRGRGTSNFELELPRKDGEMCVLLVSTTPRHEVVASAGGVNEEDDDDDDDSGSVIVGMLAIAQDITESYKHDRAVASMANELRLLIDTANAPIFGIDRDGYVKTNYIPFQIFRVTNNILMHHPFPFEVMLMSGMKRQQKSPVILKRKHSIVRWWTPLSYHR